MSTVGGVSPLSAPADGTEEVELGDASPVVDGGGGGAGRQPGSDGWTRPTPPSSLPGITRESRSGGSEEVVGQWEQNGVCAELYGSV